MGERTGYEQGTFCWIDLATSDEKGAKEFYTKLFGWKYDDKPTPHGNYCMALVNGKTVAAIMEMNEDMKQGSDVPPHWVNYIYVDDVDATTAKVEAAGGKVCMPVMDVMSAGRMSAIQDSTGAHINLWQKKDYFGAELVNEPNTWCWSELDTRDTESAKKFYSALFDYEYEDMPEAKYVLIKNNGKMNAGMMDVTDVAPPEVPSHWLVYFAVDDCEKSMEIAKEAGGEVIMGPMEVDVGTFAVLKDPQGAVFAVIKMKQADD